jgi:hypothetical protein
MSNSRKGLSAEDFSVSGMGDIVENRTTNTRSTWEESDCFSRRSIETLSVCIALISDQKGESIRESTRD